MDIHALKLDVIGLDDVKCEVSFVVLLKKKLSVFAFNLAVAPFRF